MLCKLCLQDEILLQKSHIIPDFMHKGIFDNKHFLYRVNLKDDNRPKKLSTGEFEPNILCSKCDNERLGSNLENYANKILYGGKIQKSEKITFQNRINCHGIKMTYCKGINYSKYKLFLLSILWRASISKREFFKYVSLGPYEEEIRKMILNNNPKDQMDFPCFISTYRNYKDLPFELIGQPKKYRKEHILGFTFLIGGFMYIFLISNKNKPEWLSEVAINKNNEMSIVHMDKNNAKKIINHFMQVELCK